MSQLNSRVTNRMIHILAINAGMMHTSANGVKYCACDQLDGVPQEKKMNLTIWMTLLSQAGFSLGLAAEVAHQVACQQEYDGK